MKWVLLLVTIFVFLVGPAMASTITTSASAPSTDVAISNTVTDGSFEQIKKTGTGGNWIELGQTFTVTTGFTLDKISILINQDAAFPTAGLPLYADVFTAVGVGSTSGTSLLSGGDAGVTGSFSAGTDLWMTFDVSNIALSAGIYGFKIGFTGANAATNSIGDSDVGLNGVAYDGDGSYPDGQMFRLRPPPTASAGFTGRDLSFVLQSTVPAPEPSSFVLAGLGVLGFVGYGLRRRVR